MQFWTIVGLLKTQKYDWRSKASSLFASLRSKVATASYRFAFASATIAASVRPESGSGQSSSTRRHGQSSTICMPGNLVTASTTAADRRDVRPYWLCRTYTISKTTDYG